MTRVGGVQRDLESWGSEVQGTRGTVVQGTKRPGVQGTSGLYYKHVMIVNDDSSIISK